MKLCDFGWSNLNNEIDRRNTYCGTPDYLAPEMIKGDTHDESLDLWALGVLLYEMLIGKAPFASPEYINDSRLAKRIIESNILNHKINFPSTLNADAKDLIKKLLNPNPSLWPTIKDIQNHPFMKEEKPVSKT